MLAYGLPCGNYAVRNMISLMTGEYYDCGSARRRFRDCVLIEERCGAYRVSSMMASALANPDFRSAMDDVLSLPEDVTRLIISLVEDLLWGRNIHMRMYSGF